MRIYPVVHVRVAGLALEQVGRALRAGADGVYLIQHGSDNALLLDVFARSVDDHPAAFIGLNMLGSTTCEALHRIHEAVESGRISRSPDGLWSDDIRSDSDPLAARKFRARTPRLAATKILGGIAFKYTSTFSEDPETVRAETLALREAVDVVTTSGSGTGIPPTVAKLRAMREAAARPIAVASGISSSNIGNYESLVDEILVASSVETAPYSGVFEMAALARTIEAAHGLD